MTVEIADAFAAILPVHKCGLYLEHNPHKDVYETVEQWDADHGDDDCWASADERALAIERNELWTLQWYPKTPVGFCRVAASSLSALLFAATDDPETP